jgi:hemoglobin/transferrin/lactoferrin receptor protein
MFRHNFLSLSLLSPAVLFLSVGSAQAEEPVFSFDNVVVSASKDEQRLGDMDSSMMLIQDLDIQAMVADSVDDLFQFTPGVTVSGAQNRGSGAINIRGITGNRVLTQVDGVRQPKELTFGFLGSSRHAVDLNTIKQVEVIPGPASSLYGSDALGGVVSYITKDPADILKDDKDGSAGSARTYYDSADKSWGQSLTLANRQGKLETMAVISSRNGE